MKLTKIIIGQSLIFTMKGSEVRDQEKEQEFALLNKVVKEGLLRW